jgi:hypothetical protein
MMASKYHSTYHSKRHKRSLALLVLLIICILTTTAICAVDDAQTYNPSDSKTWTANDWADPQKSDYSKVQDWGAVDTNLIPPNRFNEVPLQKLSGDQIQKVTVDQWKGTDNKGRPNFDRDSAFNLNGVAPAQEAVAGFYGWKTFSVQEGVSSLVAIQNGILSLNSGEKRFTIPNAGSITGVNVVRNEKMGTDDLVVMRSSPDGKESRSTVSTTRGGKPTDISFDDQKNMVVSTLNDKGESRRFVVVEDSPSATVYLAGTHRDVILEDGSKFSMFDSISAEKTPQDIVVGREIVVRDGATDAYRISFAGTVPTTLTLQERTEGGISFLKKDATPGGESAVTIKGSVFDSIILHSGNGNVVIDGKVDHPNNLYVRNAEINGYSLDSKKFSFDWRGDSVFPITITHDFETQSDDGGQIYYVPTGQFDKKIDDMKLKKEEDLSWFGDIKLDSKKTTTYQTFGVVSRDTGNLYVSAVDGEHTATAQVTEKSGEQLSAVVRNGEVKLVSPNIEIPSYADRQITNFKDPNFGSDVQVTFAKGKDELTYHSMYDAAVGKKYLVDEAKFNSLSKDSFFAPPSIAFDGSRSSTVEVHYDHETNVFSKSTGSLEVKSQSVGFDGKSGPELVIKGKTEGNLAAQGVSNSLFGPRDLEFKLIGASVDMFGKKLENVNVESVKYRISEGGSVEVAGLSGGLQLANGRETITNGLITISPKGVLTAQTTVDLNTQVDADAIHAHGTIIARGIGKEFYPPDSLHASFVEPSGTKLDLKDFQVDVNQVPLAKLQGSVFISAPAEHATSNIVFDVQGTATKKFPSGSVLSTEFHIAPDGANAAADIRNILDGKLTFTDASGNVVTNQKIAANFQSKITDGSSLVLGIREATLEGTTAGNNPVFQLLALKIDPKGASEIVDASGKLTLNNAQFTLSPSQVEGSIEDTRFIGTLTKKAGTETVSARLVDQSILASLDHSQNPTSVEYSAERGFVSLESGGTKTFIGLLPQGEEDAVTVNAQIESGTVSSARVKIPSVYLNYVNPDGKKEVTGIFGTTPEGILYDKSGVFGAVDVKTLSLGKGTLDGGLTSAYLSDAVARIEAETGKSPKVFVTGDKAFFSESTTSESADGRATFHSYQVKDFGAEMILDIDAKKANIMNAHAGEFDMKLMGSSEGNSKEVTLSAQGLKGAAWVQESNGVWSYEIPNVDVAKFDFQMKESDYGKKLALKTITFEGNDAQVLGIKSVKDEQGNKRITINDAAIKDVSGMIYIERTLQNGESQPKIIRIPNDPLKLENVRTPEGIVISQVADESNPGKKPQPLRSQKFLWRVGSCVLLSQISSRENLVILKLIILLLFPWIRD